MISKNDNDSNEVALTYSLDYRNLIAEGKEFMGVALGDVKFFLSNGAVKMMVVVTNLGNISYLVKKTNYNRKKAIDIYNPAVSVHNDGRNIHDYQKAAFYFLSNCHEANIIYEDR